MEYRGEGDSGCVEEVYLAFPSEVTKAADEAVGSESATATLDAEPRMVYRDARKFPVTVALTRVSFSIFGAPQAQEVPVTQELPLRDALEEFCEQLIDFHGHRGYENNDGGSGDVRIEVEGGTYTHGHNDYYVESSSSIHEG